MPFLYLEKQGEKHQCVRDTLNGCLPHGLNWGPGGPPRHLSWSGIEPVICGFAGWRPIHWATPARVKRKILLKKYKTNLFCKSGSMYVDFLCKVLHLVNVFKVYLFLEREGRKRNIYVWDKHVPRALAHSGTGNLSLCGIPPNQLSHTGSALNLLIFC